MEILNKIKDFITQYLTLAHFFIILGVMIVLIGIFIILKGMYKSKHNNLKNKINSEDNVTHLIFDLLNKTIYCFKKVNLDTPITITLEDFLKEYDEKNREKLKRWLFSLLNTNINNNQYFESINFNKARHEYYQDVFVLRSVNNEKHTLHIDHISYSMLSKKVPECQYIKNANEIDRIFYRLKRNSSLVIGLISFFPTKIFNTHNEYCFDKITQHQLIDMIINMLDKNHFITIQNNGDIAFIITNYVSDKDTFITQLNDKISKFYVINSLNNESYNICISRQDTNNADYKNCIKKLKTFSKKLINNKNYSEHLFYLDEFHDYSCLDIDSINNETKKAIENNLFSYTFKPVINSKNGFIYGYNLFIKPISLEISDFDLFVDSLLSQNLASSYLRLVVNNIISSLNDEKNIRNKKVIKRISFNYSPYLMESIIYNLDLFRKNEDIEFVFIMKSDTVNTSIINQTNFLDNFNIIDLPNVSFKLDLDNIHVPSDEILSKFKYVSFSNTFFKSIISNSKNNIMFTNLLCRLYKNHKILMAYEIVDWTTIETLICNNVFIFSGKIFETNDEINPIISKRITSKIKELYNKYH